MRRRALLAAAVLSTLCASARAGDWSVDQPLAEASLEETAGLALAGDDVAVIGFGRAWLLDGGTGETIATCPDVFPSQSTRPARYLTTADLLLVLREDDHMLFGVRTGAPMSASASASFAVCRGALYSLSGNDPANLARLEPMGRDGWVKDVATDFAVDTLTTSKDGLVLSGPGGFVEVDPAGKELRRWQVPEPERSSLRREACRTHVVDDLVVVNHRLADGEGKLRVFKGKRPRELSLSGQVVTLDDGREPFVIRRGSKEWVLVELERDPPRFVAVDPSRASAGPEVVAQRASLARSGHAVHEGKVVDLVTAAAIAGPAGDDLSVAHAFWYQQQGSTLRHGDLEGGEPQTLQLPAAATLSTTENARLHDLLIFTAGGQVGTIDLRRGRLDVLDTSGGTHVQVSACVVTARSVVCVLLVREGERGPARLRILRRAR